MKNKTEKQPKKPKDCNLETHEMINGKCVLKCKDGYTRNEKGRCVKNVLLDKKQFKTVKDYLFDLKLPISNISLDKNISYVEDLKKIGKMYENVGIDYIKMLDDKFFSQRYFYMFAIMYLIEKYGSGCVLFDEINIRPFFKMDDEDKKTKYLFIKQIMNCIKDNKNVKNFVMVIPISFMADKFSNHANMLIYKSATNTIEHFEPHGKIFNPLVTDNSNKLFNIKIVNYFKNIFTTMNSINMERNRIYYEKDIRYVEPFTLCPRLAGFQVYDEINNKKQKFNIEGGGFCTMWSIFYAEISLLNPEVDGTQILTSLLNWLKQPSNIDHTRNIIRGYIHIIMNELTVFENEFKNKFFKKKYDLKDPSLTENDIKIIRAQHYISFLNFIKKKYNKYNKTKYAEIFEKPASIKL